MCRPPYHLRNHVKQAEKDNPPYNHRRPHRPLHHPPHNPHRLGRTPDQDATLYAFNLTSLPYLLTSNFQLTISSRNPNDKIGIYYDKLDIYATYRNQQITYYTATPPIYQGHYEVNVWSPFVYGTNVPLVPYNGVALSQDRAIGAIGLMIKINGRVRWKVGSVTTGRYHVHVNCPAYTPFGNITGTVSVGGPVKYQLATNCKVGV